MNRRRKKHRKGKEERQFEARKDTLAAAITIFFLILSMVAYCTFIYFLFPPGGHLAFSILGIIGSFCLSALISYIVNERLYRRDVRWRNCLPVFFACVLSIVVSLLCMYVPSISRFFNDNHVAVYFTLWLFFAFDTICYVVFFRIPMRAWLRHGKGVRGFRRAQIGLTNLLWYQDIHREHNIGMIYPVNLSFTLVFMLALTLHLFLGWQRFTILPVCILSGLSGTLQTILLVLLTKRLLSDKRGQGFGLFAESDNSTRDILSGNLAIALYLFGGSIISFALPSLLR